MKIWVYVDGFNLYNGAVRGTPYKWLDLLAFSRVLLPNDTIDHIKFFTALVDARVTDPDQPNRQRAYWRALRTLKCVEIIEGKFMTKKARLPDAASLDAIQQRAAQGVNISGQSPVMVEVYRSEEKGTDVNLATHLVHDAHLNRFDAALILSNDSDLNEAIRIVKTEIGKPVIVYTPHRKRPSAQLKATATLFREVKVSHLRASLFPPTLGDKRGTFTKPRGW